jgi:hypothetical protein
MVKKRGLSDQELDQVIDEGTEVTPLPKTKGISFSVNSQRTKVQDKECFFCNETEKPLFAIVKISEGGVNAIVSVCGKDLKKVFKLESNGNVTFKMKEAYNY